MSFISNPYIDARNEFHQALDKSKGIESYDHLLRGLQTIDFYAPVFNMIPVVGGISKPTFMATRAANSVNYLVSATYHLSEGDYGSASISLFRAVSEGAGAAAQVVAMNGGMFTPQYAKLLAISVLSDKYANTLEATRENGEAFGEFLWDLHNNPENNELDWWDKGLIGWGGLLTHLFGGRDKYVGIGTDKTYTVYYDPLTLDLNGNGKLDVIGTDGGINFDFNGDGLAGNTGWVGKEDGILVFDDNQDGKVTNGSELFGNDFILGKKVLEDGSVVNIYAQNGFEALASLDTNGDGIVDANDKDFNKIKVWQDKNGDGKVDAGEMLTLKELGIKGLNTGYQNKNETVEGGNILAEEGSFIREDGSTGLMGDINFVQDPTRAEFVDKVEMTDEQRVMSRVEGMGRVRNLNEALTLSAQVRIYYDALKNAPSKAFFMGGMFNFLTSWMNADPAIKPKYAADWIEDDGMSSITSNQNTTPTKKPTIINKYFVQMEAGVGGIAVRPGQVGGTITLAPPVTDELVQKIKIINAFYNLEERQFYYLNYSHGLEIIKQIEDTYSALEFMIYQQVAGETRLAKYTDLITIDLATFTLDYSKVQAAFESYAENDPINAAVDLYEFLAQGHIQNWKAGSNLFNTYFHKLAQMGILEGFVNILDEKHISYYSKTGVLALSDQKNHGTPSNDILYGGFGNDKLYGGNGNDILIGGKGDDYLEGGSGSYTGEGNKTYQFSKGDGNDVINNHDYYNHYNHYENNLDIIKFTDVNSNDASYRGENYDLIIEYGQGDSIRIQNFFYNENYQINEIHFSDKVITLDDLRALNIPINVTVNNYQPNNWSGSLTITSDEQSYTIFGGTGTDTIFAGAGNDTVRGGEGNDVIYGDAGDDILYGENGNDTLYGGEGNDKLYGGNGNDILIGGKGDDYLEGGSGSYTGEGNKTYQFSKGDGNDVINNHDYYNHYENNLDIIKFTDVNSNDASYRGENYDLIIEYGQGDSIRIQNFFYNENYQINEIHFSDKVITLDDLRALNIPVTVTVNDYNPNDWSGSLTITSDEQSYTIHGGTGSDTIFAGAGNDTVRGGEGNDVIYGDAGDDILYGENGNDTLYGGESNDKLYGGNGNDILIGGKGDDYLEGGSGSYTGEGNKTYQFSKGDGNDVINNHDYYNHYENNLDIIKFTDVNSNDASYRGENYDLIIEYGQGDSIRIQNFFYNENYQINEIHFSDKVITLDDLRALNIPVTVTVNDYNPNDWSGSLTITSDEQSYTIHGGTGSDTIFAGAGNDTVRGGEGNDVIYGDAGDDILYGENGNDTLYGGESNDKLYGGNGNDILIGGKGDDYLEGGSGSYTGEGNKTYQFSKGDGNDVINNHDYYNHYENNLDIIKFTDVNSNDTSYRGENYDLIIEYGQGDSIRIQNFFKGQNYWINEIHFADGSIVKQNEIQGLIDAQFNQSLTRTMSMANESSNITVNQELHSLISAMATFDSSNNSNNDFIVTNDSSLSPPIITISTY